MAVLSAVAVLLVINMLLMHFDKIVSFYFYLYKKIIKPKFKRGEFVLIDNVEFEVIATLKDYKPYTYYCLPASKNVNMIRQVYYHESEIKKKTGLLKELE